MADADVADTVSMHPAIEIALAAAHVDPARRADALAAIAEHALYFPVLSTDAAGPRVALQFLPLVRDDRTYVCAFTSPQRWREFLAASDWQHDDLPTIALSGAEFALIGPGAHGILVNPATMWTTAVEADELGGPAPGVA